MKTFIPLSFLSSLIFIACASSAIADNRLLVCSNKIGSVTFEICGIRGCPTTVKVGSKTSKYNLKRVKHSDGSLSYSARAGSPSCNIEISTLRKGVRTAKTVSCASKIAGSSCIFKGVGGETSSSSSSAGSTTSSSSSSSSSED